MKFFSNPLLLVSLVVSLLLQVLIIYWPPLSSIFKVTAVGWQDWALTAAGSVVLFIIMKLLNPILDHIGPENPLPRKHAEVV